MSEDRRIAADRERDPDVGAGQGLDPDAADLPAVRAILPAAPAMPAHHRARIAAELAALDGSLAPIRARDAALRRVFGWCAVIVAVVGLVWAVDTRLNGPVGGDGGVEESRGQSQDQNRAQDRDRGAVGEGRGDAAGVRDGAADIRGTATGEGGNRDGAGSAGDRTDGDDVRASAPTGGSVAPAVVDDPEAPGDAGRPGETAGDSSAIDASALGAGAPSATPPVAGSAGGTGAARSPSDCAFELAPDRIVGRVVDRGGRPLEGATILVFEDSASSARYFGASDRAGCFALRGIAAGRYRVALDAAAGAGAGAGGEGGTPDGATSIEVTLDGVRPGAPIEFRAR